MEIWTEEENELRELDNILHPKGKSCKNCQWSTYEPGDEFITCGNHISNFSSNSFCGYWTDPKDEKLLAYFEKRKKELRDRLKRN